MDKFEIEGIELPGDQRLKPSKRVSFTDALDSALPCSPPLRRLSIPIQWVSTGIWPWRKGYWAGSSWGSSWLF